MNIKHLRIQTKQCACQSENSKDFEWKTLLYKQNRTIDVFVLWKSENHGRLLSENSY